MSDGRSSLSDDPFRLTARQEWIDVCDGDLYEAIILERMICWQVWVDDQPDRDGWIYKSLRDLSEDLGEMASRSVCRRRLQSLQERGILDSRDPDDPRKPKEWRVDESVLRSRTIEAGWDYDAIQHAPPVSDRDTPLSQNETPPVSDRDTSIMYNKDNTTSPAGACEGDSRSEAPTPPPEEQEPQRERQSHDAPEHPDRPEWEELDEIEDGGEFFRQLAEHFGNDVPIRNASSYWKDILNEAVEAVGSVDVERLRSWVKRKYRALDDGGYSAGFIHTTIVEDTADAVRDANETNISTEKEVDTITESNSDFLDQMKLDQ